MPKRLVWPARFRRSWWPYLLLSIAVFAVGAAWALSSPAGSSPDDDFHLPSIWCAWGDSSQCALQSATTPGSRPALVPESVVRAPCFANHADVSGACSYRLSDLPTPARVNDGGYPESFYYAMRAFAGASTARSVVTMRLVNVALTTALLMLALWVSSPNVRRALALSWLVMFVPLTAFIVASTNPSAWAVAGVGTYWAFVLAWLGPANGGRWAPLLGIAVSSLVAIGSRSDAAVYVVVSTLVVITLSWSRELPRRLLLPLLAVCTLAVFVFLTSGQSSAVGGLGGGGGRAGVGLLLGNIVALPGFLLGLWGQGWGLGWFDTPVPLAASGLTLILLGALLVLGFSVWSARKSAAVVALALVVTALPLWVLQMTGSVVGEDVQPRYVLPLAFPLIAVVLLQPSDARSGWSLAVPSAALLGAFFSVANSLALHDQMRRYLTGVDAPGLDLSAHVEWWWNTRLSPNAVWIAGSAAGVVFAWAVMALVMRAQGHLQAADSSSIRTPVA